MGRLIEENSVIEVAEKFTFTNENERSKYLDFVRYCVQNSKTAYDVEKVVAELEEEKYTREEKFQYDTRTQEKMSSYNMGLNKAISVVKRGGAE